jgi:hypothetical protein
MHTDCVGFGSTGPTQKDAIVHDAHTHAVREIISVGQRYQIERKQHDHTEERDVSSIGPCNLLQEVHEERNDMRVRQVKNDRLSVNTSNTRDQVRVVGAIPIFDSKGETIIVDHAYNKRIKGADREIIEQHHDRERKAHKKDTVLFGLISSDRRERNITHDIAVDGKVSRFHENSRETKVKFLGITIAHSRHLDNKEPRAEYTCRQPIRRTPIGRGR